MMLLVTIAVRILTAAGALLLIGVVLFLSAIAVSSLETLFWWAGWSNRAAINLLPDPSELPRDAPEADSYLVYMSGAGTMDPARIDMKETEYLDLLQARLPRSIILRDIFPYSPTNNPLVGQRPPKRFFAYVLAARKTRDRNIRQRLGIHIAQFRNTLQVGVSGDRRYGPYYNYGVAQVIAASLLRHGYRIGSAKPVILVLISGSGQVGIGCVPMLKQMLRRPIWAVSVGSILTDDPGILDVEHVYHLSGSKDRTQHLGKVFWRGWWPIFPHSAPHRYRSQGHVTVVDVGPMKHMKRGDYMSRSVYLPNGQRYADKTVEVVAEFVHVIEADARAMTNPPALVEALDERAPQPDVAFAGWRWQPGETGDQVSG